MKIIVYGENDKIRTIKIPNKLIVNRIVSNYIYIKAKKENKNINKEQIITILKLAKKYSKEYKDWKLLEIITNDNKNIDITI